MARPPRRPAPERERLAPGALRDQACEAQRIDVIGRDHQLVAAAARDDRGAVVGEHLAELRDVLLDHLRRARGRGLPPQALYQPVHRDGVIGIQGEHRQHGALLGRMQHDRAFGDARFDRPKHADVHSSHRDPTPGPLRPARPTTGGEPPRYRGTTATAHGGDVHPTPRPRRSSCRTPLAAAPSQPPPPPCWPSPPARWPPTGRPSPGRRTPPAPSPRSRARSRARTRSHRLTYPPRLAPTSAPTPPAPSPPCRTAPAGRTRPAPSPRCRTRSRPRRPTPSKSPTAA